MIKDSSPLTFFGIKFAPIWIPIERRIQVSFWICWFDFYYWILSIPTNTSIRIHWHRQRNISDTRGYCLGGIVYPFEFDWYSSFLLDPIFLECIQMDCHSISHLGCIWLENAWTRWKKMETCVSSILLNCNYN